MGGLDASTQGYLPYAYGHLGYGYLGHYYGKRSADAEADPYYLGGYALPYAAHGVVAAAVPFGSSTGLDPITQGLDAPPRGMLPTPMATLATTTVKFRELTRHVC